MATGMHYKATPMQRLILRGQAMATNSPLYNMAFRFDLYGLLDRERFKSAFDSLVRNNDCLRLRAISESEVEIAERSDFDLKILEGDPGHGMEDQACIALNPYSRCFDSCLYAIGPRHHAWFLNQHHLITDGFAFVQLFRKLESAYLGREMEAGPLFSEVSDLYLKSALTPQSARARTYWEQKCDGLEAARDSVSFDNTTNRHTLELCKDTMHLLERCLNKPGIRSISRDLSVFSILAAVLLILRYRLFTRTDDTLGTPFHHRTAKAFLGPELEIGLIRVNPDKFSTFTEVVKAVQSDLLSSLKYNTAGISSAKINNSFSWLLNFVPAVFGQFAGLDCKTTWLHPNAGDSVHDLRLQVHDFNRQGAFCLHFDMAQRRFSDVQQRRMPRLFEKLLKQCLRNPDTEFANLSLLEDQEKRMLESFNNTSRESNDRHVFDLIHAQLSTRANCPAVVENDREFTYRGIDEASNALAKKLQACDVAPILIGRSPESGIAMLAALKSAKPFVPLDIEHPDDRINSILDALGNPPLLCTPDQANRRLSCKTPIIVDAEERSHQTIVNTDNEIAYIIFTSGTTGTPKGVEVGHRSFCNYLRWAKSYYTDGQAADMPLYSSLAFDLTLTSIFLPLISGGKIVVYPQKDKSSQLAVLDVFQDDRADLVKLTPSHLRLVLRSHQRAGLTKTGNIRLKGLIVGGEDFPRSLALDALSQLNGNLPIYNEYGPTEATIGCMIHRFDPVRDTVSSVPIGKPIENSKVYLRDNCQQPLPPGFEGSLYLGGETLAKGYYGKDRIAGRLYASGDRARQLENGNLLYLGRAGGQVKFRGARVELEEVRQALLKSGLLDEALVLVTHSKASVVERLCQHCGISDSVPGIEIGVDGACNVCADFVSKKSRFAAYFKQTEQLKSRLSARINADSEADCMVLASGGKDSSYVLCKIVEMGFKPLVFTLDNGYLSDFALENIERLAHRFGLNWVRTCPPEMDRIFADSLGRHSNVCDGCFKTLYTLAINHAITHKIPSIVTGLSRGQLFETRLMDMVDAEVFDEREIDRRVDMARLAYHQISDAVSEHLDVEKVRDPSTFEKVVFFDFYRYSDVSLQEVLGFIGEFGGWKRPPDTGRSSNCRINDVGIYVHKRERHFHNYAIPYAWDVRLDHKTLSQATEELNDDIDTERVESILKRIGYRPVDKPSENESQLTAYYTLMQSVENSSVRLREFVSGFLPDYSVPTAFVELEKMPLTPSGKINTRVLPHPQPDSALYKAPDNKIEKTLVELWQSAFHMDRLGVNDNFFDLGGDSIMAVQLSVSCAKNGIHLDPTDFFNHPTIIELAARARLMPAEESGNLEIGKPQTGLSDNELSILLDQLASGRKKEGPP